jgi:hypothetical protein
MLFRVDNSKVGEIIDTLEFIEEMKSDNVLELIVDSIGEYGDWWVVNRSSGNCSYHISWLVKVERENRCSNGYDMSS